MPKLLAIVAVDPSDRVRCQQPNCGHSVYRHIHVVEDAGHLLVLGSTCFAKRYGSGEALGSPRHGGGDGRKLSDGERQLLVENTAALLAQFEAQRQEEQAKRLAKVEAIRAAQAEAHRATVRPLSVAPARPEVKASAWSWVKPMTSMAYFHLRDGTGWLRVQHADGRQMLMPWPKFEGWDEVFPSSVGTPISDFGGYCVRDLVLTVGYLREREEWEKVSGVWREIVGEIARRR